MAPPVFPRSDHFRGVTKLIDRRMARNAALVLDLNCQGFLDNCRRVQFPVREDVLQVQGDVLLRGIEEFRHFELRQPDGLLLRPQLDLAATDFGGVEDDFGHAWTSLRFSTHCAENFLIKVMVQLR